MRAKLPDLLPMRPYLSEKVWGGRRLGELLGKDLPADRPVGESWEVSAYPERESTVRGGAFAGRTTGSLLAEYGAGLIGEEPWERHGGAFPLLIKLIDANAELSIQVHPDDAYAERNGLNDTGKSEAWYVLDHGACRACVGLKAGVGRGEFAAAIEAGRALDVVEFRELRPGDCLDVRPGTVHAGGKGMLIYEVQQPSDLTFRIYDYDRPGLDGHARELHVEESLEVTDFGGDSCTYIPAAGGTDGERVLVDSRHFKLVHHAVSGAAAYATGPTCSALTAIRGRGRLGAAGGELEWAAGDTVLIPPRRQILVYGPDTQSERIEFLAALPATDRA